MKIHKANSPDPEPLGPYEGIGPLQGSVSVGSPLESRGGNTRCVMKKATGSAALVPLRLAYLQTMSK